MAKLAGVPASVVARAREVLDRLETETVSHAQLDDLPLFAVSAPAATGVSEPSAVEAALDELDLDAG